MKNNKVLKCFRPTNNKWLTNALKTTLPAPDMTCPHLPSSRQFINLLITTPPTPITPTLQLTTQKRNDTMIHQRTSNTRNRTRHLQHP